jgi:hypothetical protein
MDTLVGCQIGLIELIFQIPIKQIFPQLNFLQLILSICNGSQCAILLHIFLLYFLDISEQLILSQTFSLYFYHNVVED